MKKRKRCNVCFTLILLACFIATAGFASSSNGDEPENPMTGSSVSYSDMYALEGENLALSENAIDGLKKNQQKKTQEKKEKTEQDGKDTGKKASQKKGTEAEGKDGSARKTGTDTGNQDGDKKSGTFSEEEKEEKTPTEEVYFTTSIRDGELVTAYEYAFTITHLHEELEVEKVAVSVNGDLMNHFSGSVLLKEGSNHITVSVLYQDKEGNEIAAEKSYTVNVDTTSLAITTDLKNQQVESPYFDFQAQAKLKEEEVPLTVTINGTEVEGEKSDYSVTLSQGENKIILSAKKGSYTAQKTYTITFVSATEYSIYTTLKNQTVDEENFSFKALIVNGTAKAKLSVIVNGTMVTGNDGKYKTKLNIGNNTIRLKATDTGAVSLNETYTIKYVPIATPDTEPVLKYINVSDGMEISGDSFTLNIKAEDYQGNKIYYDGITVKLNGKKIQYRWSSDSISYTLQLKTGENDLDVRLTDHEGRYKDFYYALNCTYIEKGTPIGTVTVSVDAKVLHLGTLVNKKKVEIGYKDTIADVVDKVLRENGFTYDNSGSVDSGFYLSAICRSGITRGWQIDDGLRAEIEEDGLQLNIDPETEEFICSRNSLGQLDFCQGSGWMYAVNGTYKSYGMSDYEPEDGDEIRIRYTLAYGKEIGAYQAAGGNYGIKNQYEHTY